jgi:hypothetical protein
MMNLVRFIITIVFIPVGLILSPILGFVRFIITIVFIPVGLILSPILGFVRFIITPVLQAVWRKPGKAGKPASPQVADPPMFDIDQAQTQKENIDWNKTSYITFKGGRC